CRTAGVRPARTAAITLRPANSRETPRTENGSRVRIAVRRTPAVSERQKRVTAQASVVEPQSIRTRKRIPIPVSRKGRHHHLVANPSIGFRKSLRAFLTPVVDVFLNLLLFLRQFCD